MHIADDMDIYEKRIYKVFVILEYIFSYNPLTTICRNDEKWWEVMRSDEKWWEVMRSDFF